MCIPCIEWGLTNLPLLEGTIGDGRWICNTQGTVLTVLCIPCSEWRLTNLIFPYWRGMLVMVGGYAILKGTVLTVLVYSMQ